MSEKNFKRTTILFTIVILLCVSLLNSRFIKHDSIPDFVYLLPLYNAVINSICTLLLIISFVAIKLKNIRIHRFINICATLLSVVFIVFYVTYHYWAEETSYGGDGVLKTVYYIILITHIVFAAIVLPMVLMSLFYAFTKDFVKHKKWVKWTYPLWLYVTISGVIVYIMLEPYYPV